MATSHYFNNKPNIKNAEQLQLEDLMTEAIQINGFDCYYLPREQWAGASVDQILGEAPASKFTRAFPMEMYITDFEEFGNDQNFFGKFGPINFNNTNFLVTRRTFKKYVPPEIALRPKEGDLLYVPLFKRIYEIKFIKPNLAYHTLGNPDPFIYEMQTEAFRYSNESIDTGVVDIDVIETQVGYTAEVLLVSGSGTGHYAIGEEVYTGANTASATFNAEIKDWDSTELRLQLINVKGQMVANATLTGASSLTAYRISTFDEIGEFNVNDDIDNRDIQTAANNIVITVETNPMGTF